MSTKHANETDTRGERGEEKGEKGGKRMAGIEEKKAKIDFVPVPLRSEENPVPAEWLPVRRPYKITPNSTLDAKSKSGHTHRLRL